jgi:hypothetical protein
MIYCTELSSEVKFPSFHFLDEKSDLFTGVCRVVAGADSLWSTPSKRYYKDRVSLQAHEFPDNGLLGSSLKGIPSKGGRRKICMLERGRLFSSCSSEMPKPKVYIRHYILVLQVAVS